jgi:RimJ/RimL family protein N-acetyltransferase
VRSTPRRARRSQRSGASAPNQGVRERLPLDELPLRDAAVTLRLFEASDATAISVACRDPEISRWTFMPDELTVPQAKEWIERAHDALKRAHSLRLAIIDNVDGEFLGQIGVGRLNWEQQVGEIFYWLAAPARGRGVAARGARLVSEWAFSTLNLARLEIIVDPRNEASQHVALAAGFTREGVLRSYQRFKDGRMDAVMFSRLPNDGRDPNR